MSAARPSAASTGRRGVSVLGLTLLALVTGAIAAGPAAAIDDSTRPDARVTHGPSCRPGGVVVEVVAGTAPYAVTLATTRSPDGEDSAEVEAGDTVVLRTGDVAWGETIDGWLEYRALDDPGTTWVDELEGYTFTRPAEEDCAAITAPAAPATVPGSRPGQEPDQDDEPPAPDGVVPPAADGDVGAPAATSGGTRAIEPGGAVAPEPSAAAIGTVEVATAATAPAASPRESSVAPLFVAAVALGAAATGLGLALGRRRRQPTSGATCSGSSVEGHWR